MKFTHTQLRDDFPRLAAADRELICTALDHFGVPYSVNIDASGGLALEIDPFDGELGVQMKEEDHV